jgi:hypothetical protein
VTNGIPLGSSLLLPVHAVNCVQTLKAETRCIGQSAFTGCTTWFESVAVPLAVAVFLIVTYLMILNMLIADFTITFELALEDSTKVFKMHGDWFSFPPDF